jgi:hypothetical protein
MVRRKYEEFGTHLSGVRLKVVKGAKVDIPPGTIEGLIEEGRILVQTRNEIRRLREKEKAQKDTIVRMVIPYPGWVGVVTPEFPVLVYKREPLILDREILKETLGPHYHSVVKEDLILTIPLGVINGVVITAEQVLEIITKGLIELGLSRSNVQKIVEIKIALDVNQEKLEEGARKGKWRLPRVEEEPTYVVKTK